MKWEAEATKCVNVVGSQKGTVGLEMADLGSFVPAQ